MIENDGCALGGKHSDGLTGAPRGGPLSEFILCFPLLVFSLIPMRPVDPTKKLCGPNMFVWWHNCWGGRLVVFGCSCEYSGREIG